MHKRIQELTYDRVEANRAPADLGIDMAEFERITADCLFGKAEVDLPEGFIKIEPPFDPNSLKESATIELKDTSKTEEKKEKSSVREKLEAKKVVSKLSKHENPESNANKKQEQEL